MASPRPTPLAVPPVSPRAAGEARQSSTAQSIQSKPPTTRPKRVLGSTATATNFKPRSTRDQQTHTPSSSVSVSNARLSPSASEVSFTSRSDVSRGPEGLVCPICSEEMVSTLFIFYASLISACFADSAAAAAACCCVVTSG